MEKVKTSLILALLIAVSLALIGGVNAAGIDRQQTNCTFTTGTTVGSAGGNTNMTENMTVSIVIVSDSNSTRSTSTVSLLAVGGGPTSGRGNRTGAQLTLTNQTDTTRVLANYTDVPEGLYNLTAVLYYNNNTDDNLTNLVAFCPGRTVNINIPGAVPPPQFFEEEEGLLATDSSGKSSTLILAVIVVVIGYFLIKGKN